MSKNKLNIKYIFQDFLDRVWSIYFYLLGFYVFSRFISLSVKSWQYCNWRAFDISIIIYSVLVLFHPTVQRFFKEFKKEISRKKISKARFLKLSLPSLSSIPSFSDLNIKAGFIGIVKGGFRLFFNWVKFILLLLIDLLKLILGIFKNLAILLKSIFTDLYGITEPVIRIFYKGIKILYRFISARIKRIQWTKSLFFKLALGIAIAVFALSRNIQMIDFWILIYGLIAVLFVIESRIAAGLALICLTACPFLLIFKQEILAEAIAVYAYYFLVITVLIQIREFRKEEKIEPVDNIVANRKKRVIIKKVKLLN